ncbi:MAG: hypothetical protein KJ057_02700 [Phycisphaerae bacterium]|nr:hypothetical protein [Planctomycetia bacterium]MCL4717361.1 hypothetical protein [Phycisphaerae bacterium]
MFRKTSLAGIVGIIGLLGSLQSGMVRAGTGVTYQGQLKQSGAAFDGVVDLTFALYDVPSGGTPIGTQAETRVPVTRGLFTVLLNDNGEFGANAFTGEDRWLEIIVNGNVLTPRQKLTGAPLAQALPGVRTEGNSSGYNVVGGFSGADGNEVQNGVIGATLFGGVTLNPNRVTDNGSTVGGGILNLAGNSNEIIDDAHFATVAGGYANHAGGAYSTVAGGQGNYAGDSFSVVGGGSTNNASGSASVVGGGYINLATGSQSGVLGGYLNEASGDYSAVLGGVFNRATGDFGMCLGGVENIAAGNYSLAAGIRAYANHLGTFVWNDATTVPFESAMEHTFIVRASGGVGINTNDPTSPFTVAGTIESKSGGFKFPDGTVQVTAATGGSLWQQNGNDMYYNSGEIGLGNNSPRTRLHVGALTTFEESSGTNFTQGNFGCNLYYKNGQYAQLDNNKIGLNFNLNPDTQIGQEFRFDRVDQNGGNLRSLARIGSQTTYFIADRVGIRTTTPDATLHVNGTTRTTVLEITGGSDIAEPFNVNGAEGPGAAIEPGMVVAIDPSCAGELRLADQPYDTRVAGVISGAGGVNPGMTLTQTGSIADGVHPVALTGRVYCWVDADAGGAVRPGDMLTTSATPGHAMKASSRKRAHGAIIGKAMSSLDSGKGLVLVMVNLQ